MKSEARKNNTEEQLSMRQTAISLIFASRGLESAIATGMKRETESLIKFYPPAERKYLFCERVSRSDTITFERRKTSLFAVSYFHQDRFPFGQLLNRTHPRSRRAIPRCVREFRNDTCRRGDELDRVITRRDTWLATGTTVTWFA